MSVGFAVFCWKKIKVRDKPQLNHETKWLSWGCIFWNRRGSLPRLLWLVGEKVVVGIVCILIIPPPLHLHRLAPQTLAAGKYATLTLSILSLTCHYSFE